MDDTPEVAAMKRRKQCAHMMKVAPSFEGPWRTREAQLVTKPWVPTTTLDMKSEASHSGNLFNLSDKKSPQSDFVRNNSTLGFYDDPTVQYPDIARQYQFENSKQVHASHLEINYRSEFGIGVSDFKTRERIEQSIRLIEKPDVKTPWCGVPFKHRTDGNGKLEFPMNVNSIWLILEECNLNSLWKDNPNFDYKSDLLKRVNDKKVYSDSKTVEGQLQAYQHTVLLFTQIIDVLLRCSHLEMPALGTRFSQMHKARSMMWSLTNKTLKGLDKLCHKTFAQQPLNFRHELLKFMSTSNANLKVESDKIRIRPKISEVIGEHVFQKLTNGRNYNSNYNGGNNRGRGRGRGGRGRGRGSGRGRGRGGRGRGRGRGRYQPYGNDPSQIQCYLCYEWGHKRQNCPNRDRILKNRPHNKPLAPTEK